MPKKTKRKKGNARGPLRTTGPGKVIGVRCQLPLLKQIDSWAEEQDDKPTHPEAIRRLVEMALASEIPAKPTSKKADAKASQLAGQMIDMLSDGSAPPEEREKRKRRLVKGPTEFREIRADLPKTKA